MTSMIRYLPFAGTLPFVGCAVLLWLDVNSLPVLNSTRIKVNDVLSAYAIVIASFMAGSSWGSHLKVSQVPPTHLAPTVTVAKIVPALTNVVALALWVGFLALSDGAFWLLSGLAFVVILLLDGLLLKQRMISADYFKIRAGVTAIVVCALLMAVIVI